MELMNAQPGVLFGHQHEPERLATAISHIENKALDVKTNIEQLLFMLDLQEEVEWPDMLDKFSSLASAMTQLQFILKKSALPSGFEDFGFFLRTHVLVPHCLSNDIDANLQQATSNRIHCWNHDAAPDYLRTKLTPEVEADESYIDNEKNTRTFDQVNKQILAMNKHIETLLLSMAENARNQAETQQDIPTYSNQDTQKLVRAVVNGEGVRPSKTLVSTEGGLTGGSASGSHAVRTPGTMASPQQRR
ncbi:Mediator of RNA polymerase II transcription subunit [Dirofilaria immitis]